MKNSSFLGLLFVFSAACAGDGSDKRPGDSNNDPPGNGEACAHTTPRDVDAPRKLVAAVPYDSNFDRSDDYVALDLSPTGAISATGVTFTMKRAFFGTAVFTRDGRIGMVPQDDGTLGIFRFEDNGTVTVVDPGYPGPDASDPAFYADKLVLDPTGERMYVLDTQTRGNGGGIYALRIGCDGVPTYEGLVLPTDLLGAFVFVPGSSRIIVGARSVTAGGVTSAAADDVHLLDGFGAIIDGVDAFGGGDVMYAQISLTANGKHVLVSDVNEFATPRFAVLELESASLRAVSVTPFEDPLGIYASPFGAGGVLISGYGDAIYELAYDGDSNVAPFAVLGELSYVGSAPQLPGASTMIDRGQLRGLLFVVEVYGIRRVRMGPSGVSDLGLTAVQSNLGAVGVQP